MGIIKDFYYLPNEKSRSLTWEERYEFSVIKGNKSILYPSPKSRKNAPTPLIPSHICKCRSMQIKVNFLQLLHGHWTLPGIYRKWEFWNIHCYTGCPVIHGRFFWYHVKTDLSSVHVYNSVHWTSHFLQGTRKTRSCLTGHPVGLDTQKSSSNIRNQIVKSLSALGRRNCKKKLFIGGEGGGGMTWTQNRTLRIKCTQLFSLRHDTLRQYSNRGDGCSVKAGGWGYIIHLCPI